MYLLWTDHLFTVSSIYHKKTSLLDTTHTDLKRQGKNERRVRNGQEDEIGLILNRKDRSIRGGE